MNEKEILELVKNYVKNVCENDCTGHDWYHIQRVYNNAILINQKECANEFVVEMIVILHDLYDHKFYKGDTEQKIKELFKKLNISKYMDLNDINNIAYSSANLGFASNVTGKKELSKEGQIAQDADRLDGMGAMGISRTFTYSGNKKTPIYIPGEVQEVEPEEYQLNGSKTAIGHFYDKLLKMKDLMNTETAKNLAEHRHKVTENFLQEFLDEWNGIK